ncbi:hydroxyacylglutathione hydrolase [Sphingomonas guangdongensis]|uniref:Hydroxyacylglutathione hydrolase n=1 Tax=Sphingomonas guangdongensis TaxID=1141890 RepID=A0A285QXG9_9SPHN|nr:hydroxyacylglutathione hydrolase [Sphingomonas guangdongensis]SOB86665.1 hydroxyacylglutathione hydrolase [Sphingomonas guangdongensis]
MAAGLEVACVPVLSDNYVWLIHDAASGETVVIDPGEAAPVLATADARGWRISAIWNTHWHPDHTGGNAAVREATGAPITGPAAEAGKIPTLDKKVAEGDRVRIGAHEAIVLETPGHTAGHIVFHFADDALLFSGDTLFAMGCGRLFEGTAEQMFANMRRFTGMADATIVYGAHEYTLGNGRYALTAEPDNAALRQRMVEVERLRAAGEPTLPTNMGLERATNPFLRAQNSEEFAERRAAKDAFRG